MEGDVELERQAVDFASELTETVRTVVADAPNFRVSASAGGESTRLFIRQEPAEGIILRADDVPMLRLEVSFRCEFDHRGRFLAVEKSEIKVSAVAGSSEPLLRYDYLRHPMSGVPSAHVQVHAHRDAVTYVMTRCGEATLRGKRRKQASETGKRVPQLSDLHLPVGGARFRPCLEDFLQMLIDELGIDAPEEASDALDRGRAGWRRKQLAASVRDSPETAATVLESMGYAVRPPGGVHPAERIDKLTAL